MAHLLLIYQYKVALFPEAIQFVFVSCFLESTIFIFCYANLLFDVLHCMFSIFIIHCKQIQSNLCQIFWQMFNDSIFRHYYAWWIYKHDNFFCFFLTVMQQKKWSETINSSYANHHKWLLDNGVRAFLNFCAVLPVVMSIRVNVSCDELTVSINHQLF